MSGFLCGARTFVPTFLYEARGPGRRKAALLATLAPTLTRLEVSRACLGEVAAHSSATPPAHDTVPGDLGADP